jgi:purine-binding chemotaxis protein CheW
MMPALGHEAAAIEPALDPKQALAAMNAARAQAARVLLEAAGMELYGTFLLAGQEFALPALAIREVVNLPERITAIPLSPGYLAGIFTLRGAAIPVLNLGRIFDPSAPGVAEGQRIAILDHDGVQVGLLFDATGEVLRVRPEQRSSVNYDAAAHAGASARVGAAVINGAILLDEGRRLVQVLDANALIRVENVPQVRSLAGAARSAERARFLRQAEGHKGITFRAGAMTFALQMLAIQEIIRVPEIKASVMLSQLCKGWINLRGKAVGVVDFGVLLQCAAPAEGDDARRILIVRMGEDLLGLLVDSVDDVRSYFDSDILPIPMLSTRRAGMFRGCLPHPDGKDALFLAPEHIFTQGEVAEICAGHRRLYGDEAAAASRAASSVTRRQVYLAFSLGSSWAADISQVREIVPFGAIALRPPGMPECVEGMMQLRQQMVCVVDLRRLYGMPALDDLSERKILILEHEGESFGLVVDGVDSIMTVSDRQRRPSPKLTRNDGVAGDMRRDLNEVLEVSDEGGVERVICLFDKERFAATLREQLGG